MNSEAELELWTVEDVAEHWRIKTSWIYQHIGDLPHFKLGNHVRFAPEELKEFLLRARRGPSLPSRSGNKL